jgi:two-component system CheB/CheR fusion protein
VLSPYGDLANSGEDARIAIHGPDVPMGGDGVTSLALVLHELATNAAKYGAFSTPRGHVGVSWSIKHDKLEMLWKEKGGPAVSGAPDREGFGSVLARRSVNGQLDGKLDFDWDASGLIVHISAATERLTSSAVD